MDNDPNQPQSSSNGQQPPPSSQQPPSQSELPQEPPLYESAPQWGQQPLPQYRQPPDGQSQYGGSPIPPNWSPQPPRKRSLRWLWFTLALVGGLIALCCIGSAIFVALSIGSIVRHAEPLTCLPSSVPTTGSSIGFPAQQAGPVTTLEDNGPGSLRQAIAMAPAKSTITFDPSLRGTILLTSGDLIIAKDLTIRGQGAGILAISGDKSGHRVCVQGFSVTISGLTFKDSKTSNGFINNAGTLTLSNSTVSGNTGTDIAGISNQGTLTLNNSTVSGNTSSGTFGAGGIVNNGTLTLNNSTVSGNTRTGAGGGGGIDNEGTLTLNNSTVSGNTSTGAGGGIFNNGDTVTLTNSIVSGNTLTERGGSGGGIFNNGGTVTLTNSTVSGNTLTERGGSGGGIFNNGGTVTLTNSTVSGNTGTDGGGIGILNGSTLILSNSTVSGNKASNDGGGIEITDKDSLGYEGPVSVILLYCTVYGNTANVGGGIWIDNFDKKSHVAMGASIVAGNSAHTDPDIAGSLASLGYNLVGDRSGATFLGSPKVQSTDVLGVSLTNLRIDPKLRDNGGSAKPHTWTHALLPGSPAIDLVPPEACMMFKVQSDQRGVKRLPGKGCDSGAYQ
jgi:hypothetical protein